jgi:hypothetical protein
LGPPQKAEYLYFSSQESEISSASIKEDDLLSPTGDDLWGRVLSCLRVLLFGQAKSEGTAEAITGSVGNEDEVEIKER